MNGSSTVLALTTESLCRDSRGGECLTVKGVVLENGSSAPPLSGMTGEPRKADLLSLALQE